tara:strand:- start:900 stop:1097 length:198 start_codon:yes stop_codon:yes gene_type:complete
VIDNKHRDFVVILRKRDKPGYERFHTVKRNTPEQTKNIYLEGKLAPVDIVAIVPCTQWEGNLDGD